MKYFRNTIMRKAPPNALIVTCAFSSSWAYSSGLLNAALITCPSPMPEVMATIRMGKMKRMPNTAMRMPQVRKRRCHFSLMVRRTLAFTTALSNDRLTSRTPSSTAISSALSRAVMV